MVLFNFSNVLKSIICFQLLFFAFYIFLKKDKERLTPVLFFILNSLNFFFFIFRNSASDAVLIIKATVFILTGPFLYMYVKQSSSMLVIKVVLVVMFIVTGLYFMVPGQYIGATYTIAGYLAIFTSSITALIKLKSKDVEPRMNWLRLLAMATLISYLTLFIHYLGHLSEYFVKLPVTLVMLLFCLIINSLLMLVFLKPEVLNRISSRYSRSGLKEDDASVQLYNIEKIMKEERPYLNPLFSIKELASMCSISTHHVSQVINSRLGINFSAFLNSYRIETAAEMLRDPICSMTILEILYASGFNSKSTFNEAFKKIKGETPSAYRKNHKGQKTGTELPDRTN